MNRSWLHDSHGSFLRHDVGPYLRARGSFPQAIKLGFEFGLLATLIFIVVISVRW